MRYFLLLFLVVLSSPGTCQKLEASALNALIQFAVTDRQENVIDEDVYFFGETSGKVFTSKESKKEREILLPIGENYVVYLPNCPEMIRFSIPDVKNLQYKTAFQFGNSFSEFTLKPFSATVMVRLLNHEKVPQRKVPVILIHRDSSSLRWQGTTNDFGIAEFQIPYGAVYRVTIGNTIDYTTISIPKTTFYHLDKIIQYEGKHVGELQPSQDSALFNISYKDPGGKAVKGERFIARDAKSGKSFETTLTDWKGRCQVKIPIGGTYSISAKHFPDFTSQEIDNKKGLYFFEISFVYLSSADFEKRERDRERRIIERDSIFRLQMENEKIQYQNDLIRERQQIARQDSLTRVHQVRQRVADSLWQAEKTQIIHHIDSVREPVAVISKPDSAGRVKIIPRNSPPLRSGLSLKEQIVDEKNAIEVELIDNPRLFETIGYEVCAVLYRMRRQWNSKIVVVDMTRSMERFSKQLLLWTALEMNRKESKRFLFFNDGDHFPDGMIGMTGGIHHIKSNNLDSVINVMAETIRAGDGGKSPENDIEALLRGAKWKTRADELILVADNFSKVRDLELLRSLKVPVRIILCGVDENNPPGEDYIQIAYYTKGSIHTLEYDLMDIGNALEGQRIKIGKSEYLLVHGKFLLLNKL